MHGLVPSGSALRAAQTSSRLFVELYRSNFSGLQNEKSTCKRCFFVSYGAPGEIRTPDHLVRSQVLYPAELRARGSIRRAAILSQPV